MDPVKGLILTEWMKGSYPKAQKLARDWVNRSPDDVDAWLILAETDYFLENSEDVLSSLERAKQIDPDHPMYYRMVAFGALQANAFLAAHGAVISARGLGLPELIIEDLEALLIKKANFSNGKYIQKKHNLDTRWRELLDPSWQEHHVIWNLCYGEFNGYIWVVYQPLVAPALAFSNGEGTDALLRFPEALEIADPKYRKASQSDQKPHPGLLKNNVVLYLSRALHLYCDFPSKVDFNVFRTNTSDGWLFILYHEDFLYCVIERPEVIHRLQHILKSNFESRIHLIGPDQDLQNALPWLTEGFDFERLEEYLSYE